MRYKIKQNPRYDFPNINVILSNIRENMLI